MTTGDHADKAIHESAPEGANMSTTPSAEAEPPVECGVTCACAEQCEYVAIGLELAAELGKRWPPVA